MRLAWGRVMVDLHGMQARKGSNEKEWTYQRQKHEPVIPSNIPRYGCSCVEPQRNGDRRARRHPGLHAHQERCPVA